MIIVVNWKRACIRRNTVIRVDEKVVSISTTNAEEKTGPWIFGVGVVQVGIVINDDFRVIKKTMPMLQVFTGGWQFERPLPVDIR